MFNFGADDVRRIRGYLHDTLKNPENELEVRFSTFVKPDLFADKQPANSHDNYKPANYSFRPYIDKQIFTKTLAQFEQYALPVERIVTKDYAYKNFIRRTALLDNELKEISSFWLTKRKPRSMDLWDINTRISLASEVPCAPITDPKEQPDLIRTKRRTSFTDKGFRYDFTVINSESPGGKSGTSYEIEIECIANKQNLPTGPGNGPGSTIHLVNELANHMISCMTHILRLLQDSPVLSTLTEKHNALLEYTVLTGQLHMQRPRFIGAQPETLHKHHIPKIQGTKYAISDKFDGERFLLFTPDSAETYILGRNMRLRSTGLINVHDKGSLLDVEMVNGKLYAFDILFHCGEDLRSNEKYMLKDRLVIVQKVVNTFVTQNQHKNLPCNPIATKDYYFENWEEVFKRWKEQDYNDSIPREGFIFTPMDESYPNKPKWENLHKLKSADSIDFLVKVRQTGDKSDSSVQEWDLFVGEKENRLIPFEPFSKMTVSVEKLKQIFTGEVDHDGNIDNTTFNNRVIELVYCKENSTFVPLKCRSDKNSPNFKTVAYDVWQSIQNPVNFTDLQTSPFQVMRKMHNTLKSEFIDKSCQYINENIETLLDYEDCEDDDDLDRTTLDTTNVLDLACGRGGDLWKWAAQSSNQYHVNYVGLDINLDFLNEAQKRSLEVSGKYPSFYSMFLKNDLRHEIPVFPTAGKNDFHIVSCQFALHYFYESEEIFERFLKTVKANIIPGGIFLASMFDGLSVYELCCKGYNKQNANGSGFEVIPKFDMRMGLPHIKKREFEIGVSAVLNGDDHVILKNPTVEYLVFADLFVKRMLSNGFHLIESKLFSDTEKFKTSTLSTTEKLYSQLHRYYIFTYDPKKAYPLQQMWKQFEHPAHECMNLPEEQRKPEDLFIRRCSFAISEFCHGKRYCLLRTLETITGKTLPERDMRDNQKPLQDIVEHYNIFLGIIPNFDGIPDYEKIEIYRPTTYLEDVKMVLVLNTPEHYHLLGRTCPETGGILLTFSPPSDEEGNIDISESADDVSSVSTKDPASFSESVEDDLDEKIEEQKNQNRDDLDANWDLGKTVKQLQEFAKSKDIHVPSSVRKKQDLIDFITEKLENMKVHDSSDVCSSSASVNMTNA